MGKFNLSIIHENNSGVEEFFHTRWNYVYMAVCTVILVFSITLNGLFVYFFSTKRIVKSNFNLCLSFYSAGNVFSYVGILPYIYYDVSNVTTDNVYLQRLYCGVVQGLVFTLASSASNLLLLTFITVIRFLVIKFPLRFKFSPREIKRIIGFFWLVGFLLMLPNAFPWKLHKMHGICEHSDFFGEKWSQFYMPTMGILTTVSAPLIMFVCYALIIKHVYRRKVDHSTNRALLLYRKNIVKLIGALVLIYIFSIFGLLVYNA